jgi:hypothetical protein
VASGDGADGFVQVDRGAKPSQAVFFAPGDPYLAGEPSTDDRFVDHFAHVLEEGGGHSSENARRVATTLLPDVLPYDPRRPAAYPENGRALTDDVGDHFLALFTDGKVAGDDLLAEFPYVGPPHGSYDH